MKRKQFLKGILQLAEDVGKLETDKFNVFLPHDTDNVFLGIACHIDIPFSHV